MLWGIPHFTIVNEYAFRLFQYPNCCQVNRIAALNYVEKNPHTIPFLFQLAFDSSAERENIYAAWVWELFTIKDLNRIDPFLKEALPLLPNITNSSMRRFLSKSYQTCHWKFRSRYTSFKGSGGFSTLIASNNDSRKGSSRGRREHVRLHVLTPTFKNSHSDFITQLIVT